MLYDYLSRNHTMPTATANMTWVRSLAARIAVSSRASLSSNLQAACWIRTIHELPEGAEALRIIVRDDLEGMASAVADALWDRR